MVALRLCRPTDDGLVRADDYGGLVDMLADAPEDAHQPDVDRMDDVADARLGRRDGRGRSWHASRCARPRGAPACTTAP